MRPRHGLKFGEISDSAISQGADPAASSEISAAIVDVLAPDLLRRPTLAPLNGQNSNLDAIGLSFYPAKFRGSVDR